MSKIPSLELTRSATKVKDENSSTRLIRGLSVKRAEDIPMPVTEKKQKVGVSKVKDGFSEQAKQRALKPLADPHLLRESMPPIFLAASKPQTSEAAASSSKPTSTTKTKRPACDLKGRIQDMEEHVHRMKEKEASMKEQLALCNQRSSALEANNLLLNKDLEIKLDEKKESSSQIIELQKEIKEKSEKWENLIETNESLQLKLNNLIQDYDNLQMTYEQETSALKSNIISLTCSKSVLQTKLDASEILIQAHNIEITQLNKTILEQKDVIQCLSQKVIDLESKLLEEESTRRKLHNTIQELKGNIRVYCRMRPPLSDELKNGITLAEITPLDQKVLEVTQMAENTKIEKKSEFSFDCVFRSSSTQAEVFEEISQLVQSSIDGYNVCIFAYGQTGSGKTYTMEGPESVTDFLSQVNEAHLGMIPRSVEHIFKCISDLEVKSWTYKIEAMFLEIYNEKIRDLLNAAPQSVKCDILKSAGKGNDCILSNVTATPVTCSQEVLSLLRKARINRAVAATKCNAHSSRSHYVFQLKVYGENSFTGENCEGILNLVDLAGSERVKESGSAGERLTEAKAINMSLSNLGKVIMALSNKDAHIPYRDSKLTHLLSNSLGGNSKTLMFVNISPDNSYISETMSSLRFATKVNQCNIGTAQKQVK